MKPVRIQLSRRKGYRMPPNSVKVDRTTKWGNPFRLIGPREHPTVATRYFLADRVYDKRILADVVALHAWWLRNTPEGEAIAEAARRELRGKNLACWCPLDGQPCHADVLLEMTAAVGGSADADKNC